MKTVKYEVTFSEKASRLELLVRFLWMIPCYIVLWVLGIIATIAWVVQFLHILILGKRNKTVHEWLVKYVAYCAKLDSYIMLLTEERTPIMPE